jgi:Flagellar hook-length control protein FliK
LNGVDGSLRNFRVLPEAAPVPAALRTGGGVDGKRADSHPAFEGHLLDLDKQEDTARDPAVQSLSSPSMLSSPTRQNFLLAAGIGDAAGQGLNELETMAPDAAATNQNPRIKGMPLDDESIVKAPPERPGTGAHVTPHSIGIGEAMITKDGSPDTNALASGGESTAAGAPLGEESQINVWHGTGSLPQSRPSAFVSSGTGNLLTSSPALDSRPLGGSKIAYAAAFTGSDGLSGPVIISHPEAANLSDQIKTFPLMAARAATDERDVSFGMEEMPPGGAPAPKRNSGDQSVPDKTGASLADALPGSVAAAASMAPFVPVLQPVSTARSSTISVEPTPQIGNVDLRAVDGQERSKDQLNPISDPSWDRSLDLAPSAPMRVTVLDQQTHLSITHELSPSQQIADVVAALADSDNSASRDVSLASSSGLEATGTVNSRASGSSLQILHLQLEPESLGGVTVRMRLVGTRLDLQVEAERPETMRLIGKDKELLADKLRSAGYVMDALVIKASDPQAAHPRFSIGSAPNGREQSATQSHGDPSANDRPSTQDGRQNSRAAGPDDSLDRTAVRVTGGDLYI